MKILFYGDSIMFGQGVSYTETWINKVTNMLNQSNYKDEIVVENISVSGRTSREALIEFPRFVQSSGADILVIQFGLNDCNYWQTDKGVNRVNIESFYYNLIEMAKRAKRSGIDSVVYLTNHPISKKIMIANDLINLEEHNLQYNQKILDLATIENYIHIIDIHNEISNHDFVDFISSDGIHLSKNGNNLYAEIVFNKLKDIILI